MGQVPLHTQGKGFHNLESLLELPRNGCEDVEGAEDEKQLLMNRIEAAVGLLDYTVLGLDTKNSVERMGFEIEVVEDKIVVELGTAVDPLPRNNLELWQFYLLEDLSRTVLRVVGLELEAPEELVATVVPAEVAVAIAQQGFDIRPVAIVVAEAIQVSVELPGEFSAVFAEKIVVVVQWLDVVERFVEVKVGGVVGELVVIAVAGEVAAVVVEGAVAAAEGVVVVAAVVGEVVVGKAAAVD